MVRQFSSHVERATYTVARRFVRAAALEHTTIRDYTDGEWYAATDPDTDTIIGVACLAPQRTALRICGVYVRPEFRGRGVGSALHARLILRARERGAGRVDAYAWNPEFYERAGFELGHTNAHGATYCHQSFPVPK